ncbi:MAG: PAS domain S-box protein [Bacteroidota bacterium]
MLQILKILSTPYLIIAPFANTFKVIEVSNAYLKITNTKKKDLIEKGFLETLSKNTNNVMFVNALSDSLQRVVTTLKPNKTDAFQYITGNSLKNKKTQSFQIENTPVLKSDGSIEYIVHTLINVTEITNQLLIINEENEKVKTLLNKAEIISKLGTWELDLVTNKLTWSDGVYLICGYEPQSFEVTFEKGLSIIHPDDRERAINEIQETIKTGNEYKIEKRFVLANGEVRNIISKASLIKDEQGIPIKLFGVFQDITDKKEQEFEVTLLMDNTEESFILLNKDLEIVSFNKQFLHLYKNYFGLDVKKGEPILNYALPERRTLVNEIYQRVLKGEQEESELTIPVAQNIQKTFNIIYKPALNKLNEIVGVFVSVADITEKKIALDELKNSEEKYKLVFYNSPLPKWICDCETYKIIEVNEMAMSHYGYTKEEFLNMTMNDIGEVNNSFMENKEQNGVIQLGIVNHTKKDKTIIKVELFGNKINYQNKDCVLIVCNDVTAREDALRKLRNNEIKLLNAQKIAKLGYWQIQLDRQNLYWSNEVYNIWGLDKKNFDLSYDSFFETIHEEDKDLYKEEHDAFFRGEKEHDLEHRIVLPDGSTKWVHVKGNLFKDETGKALLYEGTVQDITVEKLLSISLQESNQRYAYATKATFDAIWDWDFVSDTIFWGDGFNIIFGYDLKDTKTDSSSWIEKIHSDDYKRIVDSFRQAIDGKESNWMAEFRFKKVDGIYAFIVNRGFIIRNKQGKAVRMVGAIQDITKQKAEEERLKLLESVITNTNDSILITEAEPFNHPGPRIIYVNEAFTKMTGYKAEEVIGKTPRILQGPKTNRLELKKLRQAMHKWESCEITTINYKKNGEEFWINFTVSPVADEKGWYTHWIAIERDITASKLVEQSLQASYYERNTILESIYDAFFAIDALGTVIYWNNKAEKFLGKTKEEMLGQNLWEVFKDAEQSVFFKNYRKAIAENETKHFEAQSAVLGGWFEVSAYPSANGLSVYFKDITERKNTEIKLMELHNDLEKHAKELYISNQELEQFAYVASHDLQEPLRMVTSFLTQLEKKYIDVIDDKGKQYIHFAVDGAKRMRQIILDLLEYSKLGKMEDKLEPLDINELLKEVLSLFYKKIEEKQAVICIDEMPTVLSFTSPLRQIFQNLIGNSLKYQQAGISPNISISAKELDTHWEFSVADNGIGIDALYFDKIFIIFQRLHHKQEYSGTGMGLAITKKIIENLGGKIWVESEEGKGSTFYFTIIKN